MLWTKTMAGALAMCLVSAGTASAQKSSYMSYSLSDRGGAFSEQLAIQQSGSVTATKQVGVTSVVQQGFVGPATMNSMVQLFNLALLEDQIPPVDVEPLYEFGLCQGTFQQISTSQPQGASALLQARFDQMFDNLMDYGTVQGRHGREPVREPVEEAALSYEISVFYAGAVQGLSVRPNEVEVWKQSSSGQRFGLNRKPLSADEFDSLSGVLDLVSQDSNRVAVRPSTGPWVSIQSDKEVGLLRPTGKKYGAALAMILNKYR